MFGWIEQCGPGERCTVREKRVDGVRFLAAGIRSGSGLRAEWSVRAAARALARDGITQAVFPRGFACGEPFSARGIEPVDVRPLRAALAADIVRCAVRQEGLRPPCLTVALCAARVTRAYAAAAEALAGEVRYLQLCAERGGWELSDRLCRRWGIAVPVLRAPKGADVILCFDSAAPAAPGIFLPLWDTGALRVTYAADAEEKCGGEPEQLLAAKYASLALRADDVKIREVDWSQSANIGVER